jgi:hypothetical protein
MDFVDVADLKSEAQRREPQQGVQRVSAMAGRGLQAHGKTAPGGLLAALRSAMWRRGSGAVLRGNFRWGKGGARSSYPWP